MHERREAAAHLARWRRGQQRTRDVDAAEVLRLDELVPQRGEHAVNERLVRAALAR